MALDKSLGLNPNDKEYLEEENKEFFKEISEEKEILKNVKYFKGRGSRNDVRMADYMNIGKSSVYFGKNTVTKLENDKYKLGVADYKNKKVIVIKADKEGHKLQNTKTGAGRIISKKLCNWLVASGAKLGKYNFIKIKGGYIGVPGDE